MDPLIGLNKHVMQMGPHYHAVDDRSGTAADSAAVAARRVKDAEGNEYYYCVKIGHYTMGYCAHEWQAEAACEALAEVLRMLGWDGHRCPVAMFAESARGFDKSHVAKPKLTNYQMSTALRQAEVVASLPDIPAVPYPQPGVQVQIQTPLKAVGEYSVTLGKHELRILDEASDVSAEEWSARFSKLDISRARAIIGIPSADGMRHYVGLDLAAGEDTTAVVTIEKGTK